MQDVPELLRRVISTHTHWRMHCHTRTHFCCCTCCCTPSCTLSYLLVYTLRHTLRHSLLHWLSYLLSYSLSYLLLYLLLYSLLLLMMKRYKIFHQTSIMPTSIWWGWCATCEGLYGEASSLFAQCQWPIISLQTVKFFIAQQEDIYMFTSLT